MKPTLLLALALAAGCSFSPGKGNLDLGVGDDMAGDAGDVDLANGPDLTMICTPGDKSCANGMLSTCNPDGTGVDTTACVLGCNAAANDCQVLQPTPPAVASDFSYQGLGNVTIAATQTLLVFNTDSGEIRDGAGTVVRMPNASPTQRNVEDGIGFHRVSGVGIWTFTSLTVPATTTVVFTGASAASILTDGDLSIAGTIDLRGYADPTKALMSGTASTLCSGTVAGPGGTIGGTAMTVAMGTGAGGGASDVSAGGGGAGYGATGGAGGNNAAKTGGAAGVVAGSAAINPLSAGLGGGASGGTTVGNGGGGGGALQLAAEGTITISGTINAGGCGGAAGNANSGGGGGGSGGAILVEAPTVSVTATGVLAANGGGGGGGGDPMVGQGAAGRSNDTAAPGGTAGNNGQTGGNGGSGAGTLTGQAGSNGNGAGGGGGGVGRVRLNSRSGAMLDASAILSPPASQGTVTIQ